MRTDLKFQGGLNVILGDVVASNSIGKSSALLIIDFALAGDSYLTLKADAIEALGHHEFKIFLLHNGRTEAFARSTSNPNHVTFYQNGFEDQTIKTILGIKEYAEYLKTVFMVADFSGTFRSLVSLFLRIWEKGNDNPSRPLHSHSRQPNIEAVNSFLKTFRTYDKLKSIEEEINVIEDKKNSFSKAFKTPFLQPITEKKYKDNLTLVEKADAELRDIKGSLAKFAINIKQLINEDTLEWKTEKDALLDRKEQLERKMRVCDRNLGTIKYIAARNFARIADFFPSVRADRLAEVETFHQNISKILRQEIEKSKKQTALALTEVTAQIAGLDDKLSAVTNKVENPGAIVDRTVELCRVRSNAVRENQAHAQYKSINGELQLKNNEFKRERGETLQNVQKQLNSLLRTINDSVYGRNSSYPELALDDNDYSFRIVNDTGTGRAYANLLIFDLAVFEATLVPVVAHDSFLFKNIENEAFVKLLEIYLRNGKQSFIAIDEIQKYGKVAASSVAGRISVSLSRQSPLYIKDWRSLH